MKLDAVAISKLEAYPKDLNVVSQGRAINQEYFFFFFSIHFIRFILTDTVRKMPMAALDNDEKYTNLVKNFIEIQSFDKNNNDDSKSIDYNYKIFENVFEGLMWLTNGNDENLVKQASNFQSIVQDPESADNKPKVNVLITGSLYLVGLSLKVLGFKTV